MKTQAEVRAAFWASHPHVHCCTYRGRPARQNCQKADTRMAFVQYVDGLYRDGIINNALAQRVTL